MGNTGHAYMVRRKTDPLERRILKMGARSGGQLRWSALLGGRASFRANQQRMEARPKKGTKDSARGIWEVDLAKRESSTLSDGAGPRGRVRASGPRKVTDVEAAANGDLANLVAAAPARWRVLERFR